MAFRALKPEEQELIRKAIVAVLVSPYIHVEEYHPRLGVEYDAIKKMLHRWPEIEDQPESDDHLAINNCLSEVCDGLTFTEEMGFTSRHWDIWFSCGRDEVTRVYDRWQILHKK